MDPTTPKNILDWNDSDLNTFVSTSTEVQVEEVPFHQRYKDVDQSSLDKIVNNLSDGIENRTISLSLDENIEWIDKRKSLTQALLRSIDKNKVEFEIVKQELNTRPNFHQSMKSSFPLPLTVRNL